MNLLKGVFQNKQTKMKTKDFVVETSSWTNPTCPYKKYCEINEPTRWTIRVVSSVAVNVILSDMIINAPFEIRVVSENSFTEVLFNSLIINSNTTTSHKFLSVVVDNIAIVQFTNCTCKSQIFTSPEIFPTFVRVENLSPPSFKTELYFQFSSFSTRNHIDAIHCLQFTKVAIVSCTFVSSLHFSRISVVGISNSYFQNIFSKIEYVVFLEEPEFYPLFTPRMSLSYCYFGLASTEGPFINVPNNVPTTGTYITLVNVQNATSTYDLLPSSFITDKPRDKPR